MIIGMGQSLLMVMCSGKQLKVQWSVFTVNVWKDCVNPLATTALGFC